MAMSFLREHTLTPALDSRTVYPQVIIAIAVNATMVTDDLLAKWPMQLPMALCLVLFHPHMLKKDEGQRPAIVMLAVI